MEISERELENSRRLALVATHDQSEMRKNHHSHDSPRGGTKEKERLEDDSDREMDRESVSSEVEDALSPNDNDAT